MPVERISRGLRSLVLLLPLAAPLPAQEPGFPEPLVDERAIDPAAPRELDPAEAPFAPPAATFEQQIAELTNIERAICVGCPLPPFKLLPLLAGVAEGHGVSMTVNDFFGHCDMVTGLSPFQRMTQAGYNWLSAAENIAAGNSTAAATIAQWMASAGHRANILSTGTNELGVGYVHQSNDQPGIARDTNGNCFYCESGEVCTGGPWFHYWIQVFGRRSGVYPLVIEREKHTVASGSVALYVYGPSGADDMRFSNDGLNWSAWQAYSTAKSWSLAAGDGLRTVFAEVRNGSTVYRSCDRIWRTGAGGDEIYADGFDCDGWSAWSDVAP